MKRRDILAAGIGGAALSWLGRACKIESGSKPGGPTGPDVPQPVCGLTDGRSLYDDFDGGGNLQTFDGQPLAVAGELSSKIWGATYGTEILDDPILRSLFSVVDENGRTSRHSRRLLVLGATDVHLETPDGLLPIEKGRVYGAAESIAAGPRGYVLKVTNLFQFSPKFFIKIRLTNPELMDFSDFKSFSADTLLSSASTGNLCGAGLDYQYDDPRAAAGEKLVGPELDRPRLLP